MANEAGKKPAAAAARGQAKIVWDDSNMKSVYANVSNVTGGREEIVMLFGMNQAWHPSQKEFRIQLTDRVVMSPFAAKRMAVMLNGIMADYEKKYGVPDVGTQKAGEPPIAS